ncbi:polysaccharide biosynthesis/export family protein [Segetibacter aerophilus]|uniref:Polysaccharide biosynthesis protein n=1 Tax=Segetibacter aerophilus TaxID=670293 RepID=A0A512BDE2_9BACT|nr:polysaccharide biosynthesis/export family protein [Segetibacter aerophilus]GEO09877.1 polysaccharide biosynthesis protein [Segetibacter aerophilus]
MKYYLVRGFRLEMVVFIISGLSLFASCIDAKKAIYFNNVQDSSFTSIGEDLQPVIQKNDLLSITVSSLNPEATLIFNTSNTAVSASSNSPSGASSSTSQSGGYLVSQEGTVLFPILGNVTAAGLTKKALTDKIAKMLVDKKLLIDPIVNIRFLNFRVTVLGEVARPTVVNVANEKISVLEAIGLAGDLTIYSKRDNVLLIREEGGRKVTKRLNLNGSEILSSPYYYLKTNDIIYAEPNNSKIASVSSSRQILPIVLSALSLVSIILTRIF